MRKSEQEIIALINRLKVEQPDLFQRWLQEEYVAAKNGGSEYMSEVMSELRRYLRSLDQSMVSAMGILWEMRVSLVNIYSIEEN